MQDVLLLGFVVVATPLMVVAVISFVLHFFVALNAPPSQRAAWTAGLAHFATAAIVTFSAPAEYALYAPLAALPAGLVCFWYWRSVFRRGWIENAEALPAGIALANDDWRIGILQLAALVALAIGIAGVRALVSGAI